MINLLNIINIIIGGGLLRHLHQPLVLWLQSRGQIRGPGSADEGARAWPDHRGAAQCDESVLHQPVPGQLQPGRLVHHRQSPAQVLSAASEVSSQVTAAHTNYVVMSGISFKARDVTELLSCMRSILRAWRNCMRWRRFWSIRDLSAGNLSHVHFNGFLKHLINSNETGVVQNIFVSKTNGWIVLNVCDQTGELCKKTYILFFVKQEIALERIFKISIQ